MMEPFSWWDLLWLALIVMNLGVWLDAGRKYRRVSERYQAVSDLGAQVAVHLEDSGKKLQASRTALAEAKALRETMEDR